MIKLLTRLSKSQKGATAVEYGLILSLVVIAALGALSALGTNANAMWNDVSNKIITSTTKV